MELNLSTIKYIHFIGIGGIGISAIARMMIEEGKKVSGQDTSESENVELLRSLGAYITICQSTEAIPLNAELIVYSRAIEVLDQEFLKQIKSLTIPSLVYPEMLGLVSKDKYTIAVSGCHGKTTTTGMVAQMMLELGADPTVVIGSFLQGTKSNFIQGKSNYFVVEADEYYRAFLNLHPNIVVITNIDLDHVDYYKDLDDIKSAYRALVAKVPSDGYVICNPYDEIVKDVIVGAVCTILDSTKNEYERVLQVPGRHMQIDAALAYSVGEVLGFDKNKIDESLSHFTGTWKRFEYKGETADGAQVYDDYAHHPTEVKASLQGFREKYGKDIYTLHVVFQPHLFSRTKALFDEFLGAFNEADEVILLPIFKAREVDDGTVSSEILAKVLAQKHQRVQFLSFIDAEEYLKNTHFTARDIIITMGAGEAWKVGEAILKK